MNKHSELIGSFIRRTNSPIEADYIFKSEQELIDFYKLPENESILHEGLFKVVLEGDNQYLYWVVNNDDGFEFVKLIEAGTQDTVDELVKDLLEEISKREELEEFVDEINERLNKEEDYTERFLSELQEIIGSDDEDYMEFLRGLDFNSIKNLSDKLKEVDKYLGEKLEEDGSLAEDLENLILDIMGDPLPSKHFRTLRGIEDIFTKRKILIDNKIKELQGEVDTVELGVGLEASGAYRPDQDTKYLKGTVSVMHALKVLDSMIDEAITHTNLTPVITKSVNLQVKNLKDSTEISADVLLDQEGEIIQRDGGLYYKVRFEAKDGNLDQYVNGIKVDTISLGLSSMVDDVHYDADTEHIIIKFKLNNGQSQEIKLPVHDLIDEWEVKNDNPNEVVTLTKIRNIKGKDQLSGDVRIADVKGNQLEKRGNALYVAAPAFGEKELQDILDRLTFLTGQLQKLESALNNFKEEVDEKFEEVHKEIKELEKLIETLREEFEAFKKWVQGEVKRLDEKIDKAIVDLNNKIDEKVKSLNERIDEEVKQLNKTISNKVKELNERIDKEVETLNNTIKELEIKLDTLKEDFEKRIKALEDLTVDHTKEITINKENIEKLQAIVDESCYWWENETE